MRSPFPGMDPYLEAPSLWPDVHTRFITIMGELLAPQVAPRYFVSVERRVYLLDEDDEGLRHIIPDALIERSRSDAVAAGSPRRPRLAPLPAVTLIEPVEVREARLVVYRVGSDRPVVTAIELLSPTNKTAGSHGRAEYLAKRRELLHSSASLVEIDLLRAGAPVPLVSAWPSGDYRVHVSRATKRPMGEVFVWGVRDELPEVPIPLLAGDPDAVLDLGKALHTTYERARYDLGIDYSAPPVPALGSGDVAWGAEMTARRA